MNLSSSDKERNQHQFDSFCKKVLRGEANSFRKEMIQRAKHEISFSDMSETELNSLYVVDEYCVDKTLYQVLGFDVEVRSELLAEALNALPVRKRDVILLSYFLDMSDTEIARLLNNDISTIHYHRTSALELLKKIFKEETKDDEK